MINERKLTENELAQRIRAMKGLIKNKRNLVQKYGKDAEKVMYGIATKQVQNKTKQSHLDNIKTQIPEILKELSFKKKESPEVSRKNYLELLDKYKNADPYEKNKLKSALKKAAKKAGIDLQLDEEFNPNIAAGSTYAIEVKQQGAKIILSQDNGQEIVIHIDDVSDLISKLQEVSSNSLKEDVQQWYKEDPKKIMSKVYWYKGQLPPSDPKQYEEAWQNIKKQLQAKYPEPLKEESDTDRITYMDIGSGYLQGFNKPHSLNKDELETLGRKIVSSLYKGNINKAVGELTEVNKDKMACNKPKRDTKHKTKSHVVKACDKGKEKIIRFGQQGVKGAGSNPKSDKQKSRQKAFKARHKDNIKKGKMSAAYWADKVKW